MKASDYLYSLIQPLLAYTSALKIEESVDERGILLTMSVSQEDMGRVIGKNGDNARAMRCLVRQLGLQNKAHISVKINEPEQ